MDVYEGSLIGCGCYAKSYVRRSRLRGIYWIIGMLMEHADIYWNCRGAFDDFDAAA